MFIWVAYPDMGGWTFDYSLYNAKKNGGIVISQQAGIDRLRSKVERFTPTYLKEWYEVPDASYLSQTKYYVVPEHIEQGLIAEYGSNHQVMMQHTYEPMVSWFSEVIEEIAGFCTIEGFISFSPLPSLKAAAQKYNIPVIYWDIAPLRYPVYKSLAYFDYKSTQFGDNEAAKRYKEFTKMLDADDSFENYIFSSKELLSLLLADKHLYKLKYYDQKPSYAWGVAPSESFGYQRNFLNKVIESIDVQNALLRCHPMDREFDEWRSAWPGDLDESRGTEEFICRCQKIVCYTSKTVFNAMLWGRLAYVIDVPDSAFLLGANQSLSATDGEITSDQFMSFITFGYFVPMEYLMDQEYLRWRNNAPSEKEIYIKHLEYYLGQLDIQLSEFLSIHKRDRLSFLLDSRNYQSHDSSKTTTHDKLSDFENQETVRAASKQIYEPNRWKDAQAIARYESAMHLNTSTLIKLLVKRMIPGSLWRCMHRIKTRVKSIRTVSTEMSE